MSELVTIDTLNTTNNLESTRNALKTLNARNTHYKNIVDVYAMSEHDGSKTAIDKPLKNVSNNLTPGDYYGSRHHFLSQIKDFTESIAGLRIHRNNDQQKVLT